MDLGVIEGFRVEARTGKGFGAESVQCNEGKPDIQVEAAPIRMAIDRRRSFETILPLHTVFFEMAFAEVDC